MFQTNTEAAFAHPTEFLSEKAKQILSVCRVFRFAGTRAEMDMHRQPERPKNAD